MKVIVECISNYLSAGIHYYDIDILPSSSSFDKSYPQFYGDHTLPLQFLWNLLLEHVNPLWILTSDLRKFFVCFEQLVVGALSSLPEAELIKKISNNISKLKLVLHVLHVPVKNFKETVKIKCDHHEVLDNFCQMKNYLEEFPSHHNMHT